MLHGSFFPTFNNSDDIFGSPYHRGFRGGYHTRNPMLSNEERRRRAEIERYNHWKQQQEILRQQREEEEELRRQRAQEEYLLRLQEAKRQEQMRRHQQQQQRRLARMGGHRQQPAYRVVRGPDGYLYRIPIEHNDHNEDNDPHLFRRVVPNNDFSREKLPEKTSQQQMPPDDDESVYEDCVEHSNEMETGSTGSASPIPMDCQRLSSTSSSPRRPTVVVEDVPEDEDVDETKSYWRNRIPGPGESWMEPIQ